MSLGHFLCHRVFRAQVDVFFHCPIKHRPQVRDDVFDRLVLEPFSLQRCNEILNRLRRDIGYQCRLAEMRDDMGLERVVESIDSPSRRPRSADAMRYAPLAVTRAVGCRL